MNYYTKEEPIVLKEYGKSIQNYVTLCINEPIKEKRTMIAYAIVDFMAQLTPQVKATSDYRKKLSVWKKKHDPDKEEMSYTWNNDEWSLPELYARVDE